MSGYQQSEKMTLWELVPAIARSNNDAQTVPSLQAIGDDVEDIPSPECYPNRREFVVALIDKALEILNEDSDDSVLQSVDEGDNKKTCRKSHLETMKSDTSSSQVMPAHATRSSTPQKST